MLDSISIGLSGLQEFSQGLKVISNNVANMNTPGFKSSDLTFGDTYYQSDGQISVGGEPMQFGTGVSTLGTFVNFADGDTQQTTNPLDLAIDGDGYFIVKDPKDGTLSYTRAGQFDFDAGGALVVRGTELQVQGYAGSDNALGPISLASLRNNPPQATSKVQFSGNLYASETGDASLDGVTIVDALGAQHSVKLSFRTKNGDSGDWDVTMTENGLDTELGDIKFIDGTPDPISDKLTLHLPAGDGKTSDVTLDFSFGVTAYSTGPSSTLAVTSSDGRGAGELSGQTFDSTGKLTLRYSNGQTASAGQLALAHFDHQAALTQTDGGRFTSDDQNAARIDRPGVDGRGTIAAKAIEGSNVDLSTEFSKLIVMQRGYQAASQIVTTADDMLQALFQMRGSQ